MKKTPLPVSALFSFFLQYPHIFKPGVRCLIACSGGPDSMALASAALQNSKSSGLRFYLGHVNHGLRGPDSDADARLVFQFAEARGIPVRVRKVSFSQTSGNLEETARKKRYETLIRMARQTRCDVVLTAHTLNDQAETVLMNLLRGTGTEGLGGIHPLRKPAGWKVFLGRPWLKVPKNEIEAFLRAERIPFRVDRTNRQTKYLRNWLRKKIVPVLEKRSPGFQERVGQLAEVLRDEEAVWAAQIDRLLERLTKVSRRGRLLDFEGLLSYSAAIQRRTLRQVIGPNRLAFKQLEALREWMKAPPSNGRMWQLKKGWVAKRLSKSEGSPSTKLFWFGPTKMTLRKRII